MSGRNVPGRRFAGGTIRTKPFLVQQANQRQKDHKKKYLRPQKNHGIKKMLKKLRGYLFLFLLEHVAGAFRTVQTVDSACQSRSRPSGVQSIETARTSWINYPTLRTIVNLFCAFLNSNGNPGSYRIPVTSGNASAVQDELRQRAYCR